MKPEGFESAREMRTSIARKAKALVGAEEVTFLTYARVDGIDYYTSVAGDLTEDGAARSLALEGLPSMSTEFWDVSAVPARERNRFQSVDAILRKFAGTGVSLDENYYGPLEITRSCRALFYETSHFLGYLTCSRRGTKARPFSQRELQALNRASQRIRSALVCAEALDQKTSEAAYAVLDAERRRLDWVSQSARGWLTPERVDQIGQALRVADIPSFIVLDSRIIRFNMLEGEAGPRVMVVIEGARRPTLSPIAELPPTRRKVAEHVAAGATNKEIAIRLGISLDTVKTHVKLIYDEFGISSRVELTKLIHHARRPVET